MQINVTFVLNDKKRHKTLTSSYRHLVARLVH